MLSVLFWGMLPIALKLTTTFTDSITLTWIRFVCALVVTLLFQASGGKLDEFLNLDKSDWLRLGAAACILILNYSAVVWSLNFIDPGMVQLNFQSSPFYLALGGFIFFSEKLNFKQVLCFIGLGVGVALFFSPQIATINFSDGKPLLIGTAIVQLAALCWCCYALLQKSLSHKVSPQNVLLFIYVVGVFVMAPGVNYSQLPEFSSEQLWIIAFCCLNTLVAYGAFAQALKTVEAVQISALVCLTPIITFSLTAIIGAGALWTATIHAPTFTSLSLMGVVIVILSAVGVQVFKYTKQEKA
jgi:drug/metabolite transporter (DMT)-like permease